MSTNSQLKPYINGANMKYAIDYIWAIVQNVLTFLSVIPLTLLGLIVVPIALRFADDSKKSATYKTNGVDEWWLRTLPTWAKLWDNPYDGFLGDDAFRWAYRDIPFGWKNTDYIAQCWWGAVRNPLHYYKSFIISCDIRKCKFELLQGQLFVRDRPDATGYQFQVAKQSNGLRFYRIYWVWQWPTWIFKVPRAAIIEIGNEFRSDHWSENYEGREFKYLKGFAFLIHPCKKI